MADGKAGRVSRRKEQQQQKQQPELHVIGKFCDAICCDVADKTRSLLKTVLSPTYAGTASGPRSRTEVAATVHSLTMCLTALDKNVATLVHKSFFSPPSRSRQTRPVQRMDQCHPLTRRPIENPAVQ
jgi:hypothetical protein